jgi:hypothetical protein
MRTQSIIWTPLPNGLAGPHSVNLSIFVSPQLQTDEAVHPSLDLFPDFEHWPATLLAGLSFEITFGALPPVLVTPNLGGLSEEKWAAVFNDPSNFGVTSYVPDDYSTTPIHSYSVQNVRNFVVNLYSTLGTSSLKPPILTTGPAGFEPPAGNAGADAALTWLKNLTDCGLQGFYDNLPPGVYGTSGFDSLVGRPGAATTDSVRDVCAPFSNDIGAAKAFHVRPAEKVLTDAGGNVIPFQPPVPIFDFHQTVSAFGAYPAVLRPLGLAFDLVVPLPTGPLPNPVNVTVTPSFTSAFTGALGRNTVNVGMTTRAFLTKAEFRTVPAGPKDYYNGMLDLADTSRFSVNDVDTDGAAEQLWNASLALQNTENFANLKDPNGDPTGQFVPGQTMGMTVPALRTIGPAVVWSGWGGMGSGLNALAVRQQNITTQVGSWVSWVLGGKVGPAPSLPVLLTEDVTKGHRFDVFTVSEAIPRWWSLHRRLGSYLFGTDKAVALPAPSPLGTTGEDEGVSVPGATSAANTEIEPTPDDLWVHEGVVSWNGWSLEAPRAGQQIDPDDTVGDPTMNTPSDLTDPVTGFGNPQFAANFTVPNGTLPKLRFGHRYRFRGRAVDLAGNSLAPSSLDASTATAPFTHFRYEPVASPVVAETNPLGPGEATLLMAILDYQTPAPGTNTINPNGRWLFPPKASEMLAETHGMLDGFSLGHLPNPHQPPNGNLTTYQLLAGGGPTGQRVDGTLADAVAGFAQDPNNHGAYYLALGANPKTPWLPDPLSRGVSMDFGAVVPTIRAWHGMPWPGADPLLVLLEDGAALGHHFTPATASAPATETVTLPAADVLDIAISSALTSPLTLGLWWWLEAQASTPLEKLLLALAAERGQLWMLSPYKVLRCVHAVRVPLVAPTFKAPNVERQYGWTHAHIIDREYVYDAKSSVDVDCEAEWSDLVDDPVNNPNPDPSKPFPPSVTSTGHVFKANVPDPAPLGADAELMKVFPAPSNFPLGLPEFPAAPPPAGVTHNIGDTRHHLVNYTATAASRFAEFFRVDTTLTFSAINAGQSVGGTGAQYGIDPASVKLVFAPATVPPTPATTLDPSSDFSAAADGTITLLNATYLNDVLEVSYVPADTNTGNAFPIHILSTVQPKAPKVVRVSPAWNNTNNDGLPYEIGGLVFNRDGSWVRVYLDRPWYSSGNNELLGVVGLASSQLSGNTGLPADLSPTWVTTMGLDPISISSGDVQFPIVPQSFGGTAVVPDPTPWKFPYPTPPALPLVEDTAANPTLCQIWPYEVNFDPVSNLWYADVNIVFGNPSEMVYSGSPPPGWFIRLALVRFQPYAIAGAEISKTVLCSFCQPVPGRTVAVVGNTEDDTDSSVLVQVIGPGYFGWRPPNIAPPADAPGKHVGEDPGQSDWSNAYAPQPYSGDIHTANSTSTIMVEIQVAMKVSDVISQGLAFELQDANAPVAGDMVWVSCQNVPAYSNFVPTMLTPNFSFYAPNTPENIVVWEGATVTDPITHTPTVQPLQLPFSISDPSQPKLRLRISELDYFRYHDHSAPTEVSTLYRRPFVCLLPIN